LAGIAVEAAEFDVRLAGDAPEAVLSQAGACPTRATAIEAKTTKPTRSATNFTSGVAWSRRPE
jgi:hypothetical protein